MSMPSPLARLLGALALASVLVLPAATLRAAEAPSAKPASAQAPAKKVDLNTATEAELIELPKIGPVTAKAILEYRKQVGTIKTVDELVNVKGIGAKTLEVLRPHVTVASPGSKS